ncbi:unnamed protein product [Rotaria socialis]|nr:unnamed protein product [Rotaria socialis]
MPNFAGVKSFKGQIKHMQDVKRFDEFKDKRVCVVGGGEAASDMALAASKHGKRAFISIRRDHGYLVSRYQYGPGQPSDLQTTRVRNSIPSVFGFIQIVIRMIFEKVLLMFGSKSDRSLNIERQIFAMNAKQYRRSHFRNTYGTKNGGMAEAILYYGCEMKPAIRSLEENSIIFEDGTKEVVDEIVCCTGFENRFSFLDCIDNNPVLQQVGHDARISHNLYKHAIHPLTRDSLVFIGFVRPCFGAIPPLAEMQARWFALLCSGKIDLPDTSTMDKYIRTYVRYIENFLTPYRVNRITNLTDFLSFSDDMAWAIGCRPNLDFKMLLRDPYLWLRCMVGPICNAQYRLCGPHAQPAQARRILLTLKWKPLWYNICEFIMLYTSALVWYCGLKSWLPHTWAPIHERHI